MFLVDGKHTAMLPKFKKISQNELSFWSKKQVYFVKSFLRFFVVL